MNRLASILALAGLIGLGGCAAGVAYGPYGGTYYSNAYPVQGYADDYPFPSGTPFDSVGIGGMGTGGGYGDWHHWRAFQPYQHWPYHHWGAWRGGAFRGRPAWTGAGHWAGHGGRR